MTKKLLLNIVILVAGLHSVLFVHAQQADSVQYKTVVAGKEYNRSKFYQALWGKHYRKEWITPVKFKIVMLDTLEAGLIPYEAGGSRQTKSLKLRDKNNREYVLRSVDKTFAGALPYVAKGSFIEDLANDQVSIAHPYASLTIAPMADAIGVYHTNPQIFYIPKQSALGKFNEQIGDNLYLFEQRPDENWSTAPNFGNAKDIKSTDKMLDNIHKDNDRYVDQAGYLRARLFDMIIGDWGRHEDQWRWAEYKEDKKTRYEAIPRDRDQAYTVFDGVLIKSARRAARIGHLQTFSNKIKDVTAFNFPARNLDRHLLNELTLSQWLETTTDIQQRLTDAVIDHAVKQLPPEVYNISGSLLTEKLKSRRNHLKEYAEKYYKVLARSVDITGTADREFFEINRLTDSTRVNIYSISKNGKINDSPFYSRVFHKGETFEVRLYGLSGEDEYRLTGDVNKGISIRLIGGTDRDKFTDLSHVKGFSHKTEIYDDKNNEFIQSRETALHISSDSASHSFKYNSYKFDKRGFKPTVFYSYEDRFFAGISYVMTKNKWRKEPYGFVQYFDIKYSITQRAFSSTYKSNFTDLIGKWNGVFYANYDFMRWTNFFGLGNETKLIEKNRDFNRMRSSTYLFSIGAERIINKYHKFGIHGFYQGIDMKVDSSRFVAKAGYHDLPGFYSNNGFAGVRVSYLYQKLDDSILPGKGISFLTNATYTGNLHDKSKSFGKLTSELNLYAPLSGKFGLAFKFAGATLTGIPLFYQYNNIGGSETLRGYRRERFYGNSTAYSQTELQWISPVHSYIYNGKIGFFGLYDIGRVWLNNEHSNKWHSGYGGGIILSPFNLVSVSLSYAVSAEDKNFHIQLIRAF